VVFQGDQKPAVHRCLGVTNDIGAKLAHDKFDVGDVLVYDAQVFQQRVPDPPGDPQIGSVAGQVQRHFEYHESLLLGWLVPRHRKGVPEMDWNKP